MVTLACHSSTFHYSAHIHGASTHWRIYSDREMERERCGHVFHVFRGAAANFLSS